MRILTAADMHAVAAIADLIAPIAAAMRAVSQGKADMPLRDMIPLGGGHAFGIMTGALREPAVHGAKLLSLYPDNPRHGRSSHSGLMVIFDDATGLPRACLDAATLTALRTAAATAVATEALAPADARRLAILGCGEQAHAHIEAMRAVRRISRIAVWGRDPARARAFAARHGVELAATIEEAVAEADIVCTTTPATAPLLGADMLHPGLHINAVGASIPAMQEIAADVVPRVHLVTDYRPSLEAQAAEVIAARRAGLVPENYQFPEIGEVLDRIRPGRSSADEITLYRSLGIAAQDLAGALEILARAEAAGRGTVVAWA